MKPTAEEIEGRLESLDGGIELIALERPGRDAVRIYIDHPDGVSLKLCERVTSSLGELLADHSLEVSSPGSDRPLTKPSHYARFKGRRARVRLREPIGGRRKLVGTILEADESTVSIAHDDAVATIPYERIDRSNLVPDFSEGVSK